LGSHLDGLGNDLDGLGNDLDGLGGEVPGGNLKYFAIPPVALLIRNIVYPVAGSGKVMSIAQHFSAGFAK